MSATFGARRIAAEWWLVAFLSTAVVLVFAFSRVGERIDHLGYDRMLRFAAHEPDPRLLLVGIDSRSLQEVGRWPWPRDVHAALIVRLAAARPRAIVYDVLLLEPGPHDAQLAGAIHAAPPFYLPYLLDSPGPEGARFEQVLPVAPVRAAASGLGHVNLYSDVEGVVRRVQLIERDGARHWPHLMAVAWRDIARRGPLAFDDDPVLLPFAGPAATYPAISAAAVLRGELPPELLRDRIVIVGASAQGLGDHHPVPVVGADAVMAGIEIQANLLDALLNGRLITEPGGTVRALVGLVPLWIFLLALRRFRPAATLTLLVGLVVLVLAFSAAALVLLRLWVVPTPALAGLFLVYPLWGWRRLTGVSAYMVDELERLRSEPDGLAPLASAPAPADPVLRETMLLGETIGRLRATRRFVQDSLDRLPDALFVLDADGDIALANRSGRALLDASGMDDAPSSFRRFLAHLGPSGNGEPPRHWPPGDAGDRFEAPGPDGRLLDILLAPYGQEPGRGAAGWIVRLSDVSALRLAQRQRDDMLNFLTHDMRSPQASILALTASAKPGEIDRGLAQRIDHYARRTLGLADGIVHLARAEMLTYEPIRLDLGDLLKDAIDDVWPQVTRRKMTVDVAGADTELPVMGEPSLLTRALINLLDNALKHSPEGSRLHCTVGREDGDGRPQAVCSIRDEGEGIDAGTLASLFERFRQGAAGASRGGVGLGLSFVQTVMARHGGTIACASQVGTGSTFTVRLPLAD
jgi:CHASE2 domain-containing sensor protein